VRPAVKEDIARVAAALAAAFDGDEPLRWFVPDTRRRYALLERYFHAQLPLFMANGEVWTSDEVPCGAAWVAPARWPFGTRDQLRSTPTMVRVFGRRPLRALAGLRTIERGHPHEAHWYLDSIGVDPTAHGRGAGSALLAAMARRLDAEGSPAYLNAGSARSRDLYLRHGFEVREEFRLPFGGPPLWRMWRSARLSLDPG
jgi:ribosomal protein S18 acetylase RimI-like enzyme